MNEYDYKNDGSQRHLGLLVCIITAVFMTWGIYEVIRIIVDNL